MFGASTPSRLSASDNDYQDKGSESYRTFQLLSQRTGVLPGPSIVVVASAADARAAVTLLRRDPAIAEVRREPPRAGSVVIAAYLRNGSDTGRAARSVERSVPGLVGGPAVASEQVRRQSERDLIRAELIAFPLLLVLGIWIFRGVVAALLPVAAGVLSIVTTLAMLRLANSAVTISVFALNLVTGAGLGLAIDYSLLLLTRYREELARSEPREALLKTVETAGRTVAFSAVTVAAAFASLLVFPLAFLRSMAIGGLAVALLAGVVALLVIPALFALLGRRVDALALRRGREPRQRWLVPLRARRDAEAAADRRRDRRRARCARPAVPRRALHRRRRVCPADERERAAGPGHDPRAGARARRRPLSFARLRACGSCRASRR